MSWEITITKTAEIQILSFDKAVKNRIIDFLKNRILLNPRSTGKPLVGDKKGLWAYRVGDYRIFSYIDDDSRRITILEIGHRRDIYKRKIKISHEVFDSSKETDYLLSSPSNAEALRDSMKAYEEGRVIYKDINEE